MKVYVTLKFFIHLHFFKNVCLVPEVKIFCCSSDCFLILCCTTTWYPRVLSFLSNHLQFPGNCETLENFRCAKMIA